MISGMSGPWQTLSGDPVPGGLASLLSKVAAGSASPNVRVFRAKKLFKNLPVMMCTLLAVASFAMSGYCAHRGFSDDAESGVISGIVFLGFALGLLYSSLKTQRSFLAISPDWIAYAESDGSVQWTSTDSIDTILAHDSARSHGDEGGGGGGTPAYLEFVYADNRMPYRIILDEGLEGSPEAYYEAAREVLGLEGDAAR
jgi:hypothetical protein